MANRDRPLTPITESNSTTPRGSFFQSEDLPPQFHTNEIPPLLSLQHVNERTPSRSSLSRTPVQSHPYPASHIYHTSTGRVQTPTDRSPSPSTSTSTLGSFQNLRLSPTVSPSSSTCSRSSGGHSTNSPSTPVLSQNQESPGLGAPRGAQSPLSVRHGSISMSKRNPVGAVSPLEHPRTSTPNTASTNPSLAPTRIPLRTTSAIPVPVRTGPKAASATATTSSKNESMSSTPPRVTSLIRSVSALDTHLGAPHIPPRQSSADLPPRPTTSTDSRPRPRSVGLGRSTPIPTERPSSFHGPSPTAPVARRNSLLKKAYGSKSEQLDISLASVFSTRVSLDLKDSHNRSPSRSRERRVSFQGVSPSPPDSEERRRPSSPLSNRPSLRISSLLSRFKTVSTPSSSPLSGVTSLLDVAGELGRTSPIRSAIRALDRFGICDDDVDGIFTPHLHHLHRRTSNGSIVEGARSRVLYAENPDVHSSDEEGGQDEVIVTPEDATLNLNPPPLSRSSSAANTSTDSSLLSPSSPCSTFVYGYSNLSHESPLLSSTSPGSTSVHDLALGAAEGGVESPSLLILAVQMLNAHAVALIGHAEAMNEVSRSMRAMADESLELGSRVLQLNAAGGGSGELLEAALGLMNIGGPPRTPQTPLPLSSHPATTWNTNDRRPMRHQSLSLPRSSPMFHPSPSERSLTSLPPLPTHATLPSALMQAEHLGRDGWAYLRAAEEAVVRTMEDLRFASEEDSASTVRPDSTQTTRTIQTPQFTEPFRRSRSLSLQHPTHTPSPVPSSPSPGSRSNSPMLISRMTLSAPTPVLPGSLPGSRRPSLATLLAQGVESAGARDEGDESDDLDVLGSTNASVEGATLSDNGVHDDDKVETQAGTVPLSEVTQEQVAVVLTVHSQVPSVDLTETEAEAASPLCSEWANITTESASSDKVNIVITPDIPNQGHDLPPLPVTPSPPPQSEDMHRADQRASMGSRNAGRSSGNSILPHREGSNRDKEVSSSVGRLHRRLSRRGNVVTPPMTIDRTSSTQPEGSTKRRWYSLKWKKEASN